MRGQHTQNFAMFFVGERRDFKGHSARKVPPNAVGHVFKRRSSQHSRRCQAEVVVGFLHEAAKACDVENQLHCVVKVFRIMRARSVCRHERVKRSILRGNQQDRVVNLIQGYELFIEKDAQANQAKNTLFVRVQIVRTKDVAIVGKAVRKHHTVAEGSTRLTGMDNAGMPRRCNNKDGRVFGKGRDQSNRVEACQKLRGLEAAEKDVRFFVQKFEDANVETNRESEVRF